MDERSRLRVNIYPCALEGVVGLVRLILRVRSVNLSGSVYLFDRPDTVFREEPLPFSDGE